MQADGVPDSRMVRRPILRRIALGLAALELVLGGGFAAALLLAMAAPLVLVLFMQHG